MSARLRLLGGVVSEDTVKIATKATDPGVAVIFDGHGVGAEPYNPAWPVKGDAADGHTGIVCYVPESSAPSADLLARSFWREHEDETLSVTKHLHGLLNHVLTIGAVHRHATIGSHEPTDGRSKQRILAEPAGIESERPL